jgi:hypothetical protein
MAAAITGQSGAGGTSMTGLQQGLRLLGYGW